MQYYSNTGEGLLSAFLQGLVQSHLAGVLAANQSELQVCPTPEPKKRIGEDLEALILSCCESVKAMAWSFARSSSRVDADDMYSIGMLEMCECVAAGRGLNADNPRAYLCKAARYAMIAEWRRLYGWSTVSLDAPLFSDSPLSLADLLPDRSTSSALAARTSSKHVRALNGAIRRLSSARQRAVLRRRAGLPGYGAHSLEETARALHTPSTHAAHMAAYHGRRNLRRDARLCMVLGVGVQA